MALEVTRPAGAWGRWSAVLQRGRSSGTWLGSGAHSGEGWWLQDLGVPAAGSCLVWYRQASYQHLANISEINNGSSSVLGLLAPASPPCHAAAAGIVQSGLLLHSLLHHEFGGTAPSVQLTAQLLAPSSCQFPVVLSNLVMLVLRCA